MKINTHQRGILLIGGLWKEVGLPKERLELELGIIGKNDPSLAEEIGYKKGTKGTLSSF